MAADGANGSIFVSNEKIAQAFQITA